MEGVFATVVGVGLSRVGLRVEVTASSSWQGRARHGTRLYAVQAIQEAHLVHLRLSYYLLHPLFLAKERHVDLGSHRSRHRRPFRAGFVDKLRRPPPETQENRHRV